MTTPRKTPNPYSGVTNRKHQLNAWADGYKCGHSDAEMDERGKAADLEVYAADQALELIRLKDQTSNLVEKNGNQVATIKVLDERLNDLRITRENLRIAVNRLQKDNSVRGGSILDAQAKIRDLEAKLREFTQRSDSYHGELGTSYDNGYNTAIKDIMVFAQSTGATVKFLTAEQYSQLEGINAKIGAKIDDIELDTIVIEEQVTLLGEVLGDIESPSRQA